MEFSNLHVNILEILVQSLIKSSAYFEYFHFSYKAHFPLFYDGFIIAVCTSMESVKRCNRFAEWQADIAFAYAEKEKFLDKVTFKHGD